MDESTPLPTEQPEITPSVETSSPAPQVSPAGLSSQSHDVATPHNTAAFEALEPPKKSRKKLFMIIGGVIALLIIGLAAFLLMHKPNKSAVTVVSPIQKQAVVKKPVPTATKASYLSAPSVIPDPKVFTNLSALFNKDSDPCGFAGVPACSTSPTVVGASDVDYYSIGKNTVGQSVILAVGPSYGMGDQDVVLLVQDSASHYIAYLKQFANEGADLAKQAKGVGSNVAANTTDVLPDFTFAAQTSIKGLKVSGYYNSTDSKYTAPYSRFIKGLEALRSGTNQGTNRVSLGTVDGHDFYSLTATDSAYFKVQEIYATLGGSLAANYGFDDPITNTKAAPKITWTGGEETANSHHFTSRPAGCGSANGYIVAKSINSNSLISSGTTAGGTTVYQLPVTDPLFVKIYTEDYGTGEYTEGTKYKNLSKEQFNTDHGMFVAKNALGEYVVYQNTDVVLAGGGCAKPVVYLYPTKKTDVNVKVGAKITKSVPLYKANGWQHVTAQPNGQLTYQGQQYDSLFWEGLGLGSYPLISSGTVVAHDKVVATIKHQLAEQGLNAKETTDFLTYWAPKLPTAPYTRLTWFSTAQLNELAPLTVTPKPQTVIRTFLDFQGLNTPVSIAPQTFHAPARTGFTVVEWGGLLRK